MDEKLNDKHPRPALEAMDAVEIAAQSLGFHGVKSFGERYERSQMSLRCLRDN